MTVFNFGIFRTPVSAAKYSVLSSAVANELSRLTTQLNTEHQGQKSPQLTVAFAQLAAIEAALRQGPNDNRIDNMFAANLFQHDPLSIDPDAPAAPVAQPAVQSAAAVHKQAKQTALFLEQQLQSIVKVYNKFITAPEISAKDNQSMLAKVKNVFADMFTKLADLFRNVFGAKVRANWTHSSAQSKVDGHFRGVFDTVENAKMVMSSKFETPPAMDVFQRTYRGL